jgi:hypothetical protein
MEASSRPTRPPVQRNLYDRKKSISTDISNGVIMTTGVKEMPLPKITLRFNTDLKQSQDGTKFSAWKRSSKDCMEITSVECTVDNS